MKKKQIIATLTAMLCWMSTISVPGMALTTAAKTTIDHTVQSELDSPVYRIGISEEPDKTDYIIGEELDLTGLRLNGSYQIGELISCIMNEDYQELLNSNVPIKIDTSGFDNTKAGTYHIYVLYGDAKDSFKVTVYNDQLELSKNNTASSESIKGDVNGDESFGVSDAVLLQKWLLAVPDTHLANWKAADFCDDDRLDVFDLALMKRALIYGELVQPTSPTTQHIGLNHTDEVIELLNNYDLNNYHELYRDSLYKMFERFNEDGYIYTFIGSDNDGNTITLREEHPNAAIVLMPYMDYEDTGILYHVAYKEKYYQVYYYFTDPAYPASNLWDYLEHQRMNIKNIKLVDEKFGIVDSSDDKQSDLCAFYVIDDTHYCKVRTYESEDALIDFLQVLKHDKLYITDNTASDPIVSMTAQPVGYKNMEAAIEAINNCDVSS